MAERRRFSVGKGEQETFYLPWDADGQPPLGEAHVEWSVVVLDDMTVDLEVSAQLVGLGAQGCTDANGSRVLLQRAARGRTFHGAFDPAKHTGWKAAVKGAGSAGSVVPLLGGLVFDLNNKFSWRTPKEIEVVTLRIEHGPPSSRVPPLPPCRPLSPAPRGCPRMGLSLEAASVVPTDAVNTAEIYDKAIDDQALTTLEIEGGALQKAVCASACIEANRAPDLLTPVSRAVGDLDAVGQVRNWAAHLDSLLEDAHGRLLQKWKFARRGEDQTCLEGFVARLDALRGLIQKGPPPPPPKLPILPSPRQPEPLQPETASKHSALDAERGDEDTPFETPSAVTEPAEMCPAITEHAAEVEEDSDDAKAPPLPTCPPEEQDTDGAQPAPTEEPPQRVDPAEDEPLTKESNHDNPVEAGL